MTIKALGSFAFFSGIIGLAALTRFWLTETESRTQILVFCSLTACVEWGVKPLLGMRPRLVVALFTGVGAAGAILIVRWHLEGLCPHTWPQCPDPVYAVLKSLKI